MGVEIVNSSDVRVGIGVVNMQTSGSDSYNYKFGGKELQDELGLNWTAMDFRNYDPALGRFHSHDRLSESAPMHNPYRFAFNNPVYWRDPTGLFEQNLETCPTCPQTPEFKPYIDDPNTTYIYDPETNTANELIVLTDAAIIGGNNNSRSALDYLRYANTAMGSYGNSLANSKYGGGSFAIWNGPTKRSFDGIKINEIKYRYSPHNRGFNQYTGKGTKVSKVIQKGSLVTSVVLEVPEIVDGFGENTGEGIKQTAGGIGSVVGGVIGGATLGVIVGAESGPGALVTGIVGGIIGGVVGEEVMEFYIDAAMTPLTPEQKQQNLQREIQKSQTVYGPLKY
ncbi:hypothetical protein HMPREF2660_08140 [Weeksella sp. HMSC059D05]|nr:hypothetical protein HMPREF2660_08140 [Weeksella sp. HMSC059D05]